MLDETAALHDDSDDYVPSHARPARQLEITLHTPSDRIALMQDLIAIGHDDDTITLEIRASKKSSSISLDVYLRSHTEDAYRTLAACEPRVKTIVKRYEASLKTV